jgi:hypothetical protein
MPPGAPGAPPYPVAPVTKTSSALPIVIVLIAVFFGGIFVLGIVAAIAIPGFLRARMSANEAAAIGTLRTMSSAQAAWAATHGGTFTTPQCLGAPATCGEAAATGLLPGEIASLETRSGYRFGFVLRPGGNAAAADAGSPTAPVDEAPGAAAPDQPSDADVRAQLEQFATPDTGETPVAPEPQATPDAGQPADPGGFVYWAVPATPGTTGNRGFCVDETGVVLEYRRDAPFYPPTDAQPRCPDSGQPLP